MKRLFLFILIFISIKAASATVADSALVEHTSLENMMQQESLCNPALHGIFYQRAFSQLALGIDLQRQSTAFIPEKGKGYALPYLKVNTYHHLNDHSTVWGEASYTTGKQYDIKWNSTSDYDLLNPYILADTLGGDIRHERYWISGGYATQLSKWLLGGEMLVRAQQEYRSNDPRMRGVVTDLTLRLGCGYDLGRYRVGATIEGNIYKQTNSVAFYREEGVIPEYQMTGLGTEYSRFSGDKRSLYYDGSGMAVLLHATPISHNGVYAEATLEEHRYHRKLAEFNSMPLTDLYNEHVGATIGWKKDNNYRLNTSAHLGYTRRTGNEHVGGTSDARYFPVIACLTMYKSHTLDSYLRALYGKHNWNLILTAGYKSHSEEYIYPHRQMDASHVYGKLQGQCFLQASAKMLLTVNAHVSYASNVSDKMQMPYANMGESISQLMRHKHEFAKTNYTDIGAKVRADYAWKQSSYGFFIEAGGGMTLCSASEQQTLFHSSIGITF